MFIKYKNTGSALILTLIVITSLSLLALYTTHIMRNQNRILQNYHTSLNSFHITRAAINGVLTELKEDKLNSLSDHYNENWHKNYVESDGQLKEFNWEDIHGNLLGTYTVMTSDESGKLNLNYANFDHLNKLFSNLKVSNSQKLSQNILNDRRKKIANGSYISIFELIQVEHIDLNEFLGEDVNENGILDFNEQDGEQSYPFDNQDEVLDYGIKDYLTLFASGKVNLNTASKIVLLSMPGMNEEVVNDIINIRKKSPFTHIDELKNISSISETTFKQTALWSILNSDYFKIVINSRLIEREDIFTTIIYVDRSEEQPKIIYWRES